jgi:hypothetical protein
MSARSHTLLRLAAVAWIAALAWMPWESAQHASGAKAEPTAPAPAVHAAARSVAPAHAVALAMARR